MANNRIYLRCKRCGAELCLGKRYIDGYYYPSGSERLEDLLNKFYDEHAFCDGDANKEKIHWLDHFETSYEIDPKENPYSL